METAKRLPVAGCRLLVAGCRWFWIAGEADHGEAIGKAGDGGRGFEGLLAYGSEEDTVEREGVCRGGGQAQMAAMDGVECATEEGYAHSAMLEHFHDGGMGSGVNVQAMSCEEGRGFGRHKHATPSGQCSEGVGRFTLAAPD